MKKLVVYDEDGGEIELPFKWVICSACDGHGKSSAYLGAYTQSEMDEQGPEFFEQYMAGGYDKACDACQNGKAKVPDYSKMSKAEKKAWKEQCEADAECEMEAKWEQKMLGNWQGI